MGSNAKDGAPQVVFDKASSVAKELETTAPAGAWGMHVVLYFRVWKDAITSKGHKVNQVWLKQTIDVNGLVWETADGERKPFIKHVEEYFALASEPDSEWARTSTDTHEAYYFAGNDKAGEGGAGGAGLYGLQNLPCGYSITVQATVEVGRFHRARGSDWGPPAGKFYLDTEKTQKEGPTAPVGGVAASAALKKSPTEGDPEKTQPADSTGFLWESLTGSTPNRFPSSSYWYWIGRDSCPRVTITPGGDGCRDSTPTSRPGDTAEIERGPGGEDTPWQNKDGTPGSTGGSRRGPGGPGDCVLPLPPKGQR